MKLFKKKEKVNNAQIVSIFPITKSIRYNSNLQPSVIKRQIALKMLDEIMLYMNFETENKNDGTILMIGRLDVVKDGMPEVDKDEP